MGMWQNNSSSVVPFILYSILVYYIILYSIILDYTVLYYDIVKATLRSRFCAMVAVEVPLLLAGAGLRQEPFLPQVE